MNETTPVVLEIRLLPVRFIHYNLIFAVMLLSAGCASSLPRNPQDASECVILLHGIGRSHRSLAGMEKHLRKAGYYTVNLDYPSTKQAIEESAQEVIPASVARCEAIEPQAIHFVTHSMGALLLRSYLECHSIDVLGRVVMLGPPNQGSIVADQLRDKAWFKKLDGPAGQQLGQGPEGIAARLGPVTYPVGVVAGTRASIWDLCLRNMLPEENDGKVAVASTQVVGMTDFIVLPHSHTYMMNARDVIEQTHHFLQYGSFKKTAD